MTLSKRMSEVKNLVSRIKTDLGLKTPATKDTTNISDSKEGYIIYPTFRAGQTVRVTEPDEITCVDIEIRKSNEFMKEYLYTELRELAFNEHSTGILWESYGGATKAGERYLVQIRWIEGVSGFEELKTGFCMFRAAELELISENELLQEPTYGEGVQRWLSS